MHRRLNRRFAALSLTVAMISMPAAAGDVVVSDERIDGARTVREAAGTGSLAAVLESFPAVPAVDAGPVSVPASVADSLRSLPAPLATAIAGVVAATLTADATARAAVPAEIRPQFERAFLDYTSGRIRTFEGEGEDARPAPWAAELARAIDLPSEHAAARRVARAADAVGALADGFPGLLDVAAVNPTAECDVAQVESLLCVGGGGANTYSTDFWVTIDLGGADTYLNSAGSTAACGHSVFFGRVHACARVVIDLSGDDRYGPVRYRGDGRSECLSTTCGQGVGMFAGIGMLIDRHGDDEYLAELAVPSPVMQAQGSAAIGVGILADMNGNDLYRAEVVGPGAPVGWPPSTYVQGETVFGTGLLWDRNGDDRYEHRVLATGSVFPSGAPTWLTPNYEGQGLVACGVGGIVDGGGRDVFSTTATPHRDDDGAGADFSGQGYGISNCDPHVPTFGGLIVGPGDTSYLVDVKTQHVAGISVHGFGNRGLLSDEAGNDSYVARASASGSLSKVCSCSKVVMDMQSLYAGNDSQSGREVLDHTVGAGAQGIAEGLLHDASGHDRYSVSGEKILSLHVRNNRAGAAAVARVLKVGSVGVGGQGRGGTDRPFELLDEDGNDIYELESRQMLTVEASAPSLDGKPPSLEAFAFPLRTGVSGQNLLTDLGGADRYDTRAESIARALPDPGGHADGGSWLSGSTTHRGLIDQDNGEPDVFRSDDPSTVSTCDGRYGHAPGWIYKNLAIPGTLDTPVCAERERWFATRVSSVAPRGADTALDVAITPPEGAGIPVAQLAIRLDSDGTPLPGRRIVVRTEFDAGYGQTSWWDAGNSVTLVTGADGVARGSIFAGPICAATSSCGFSRRLKAIATFSGDPGSYEPSIADSEFTAARDS